MTAVESDRDVAHVIVWAGDRRIRSRERSHDWEMIADGNFEIQNFRRGRNFPSIDTLYCIEIVRVKSK